MGTFFIFSVADALDKSRIDRDVDTACSVLTDADNKFSLYKENSEISLLNSGQLNWNNASEVQKDIRNQVESWRTETNGFFNAVSPSGVYDPSGLVKTWSARNAAMYLEANGYRDFTLNAGGDVYLGPEVKTDPLTRVGLSNLKPIASKESSVHMVLDLKGTKYRAVATSGSVERGDHIWATSTKDKRDQYIQATVIGEDIVTADIWATALISGGSDAFNTFENSAYALNAVALVTSTSGSVRSTSGFTEILANLN